MASFEKLCAEKGLDFDHYWKKGSSAELWHFIGKDIINFHALFWPAMLDTADFRQPTQISVNGFLTVNGQKMSKSRGTFIMASTYHEHLNPEYLRYYFAAKLSSTPDDLDLNLEDFALRVNADLVGKLVNIASRCAGFISKNFEGMLAASASEPALTAEFRTAAQEIADLYDAREFAKAMRLIMALADKANAWIAEKAPWSLSKANPQDPAVQQICSVGINLFRLLMIYLKPVLPAVAQQVESFLNVAPLQWSDSHTLLVGHQIHAFTPLMTRVDPASIEGMVNASKETLAASPTATPDAPLAKEPIATEIEFPDFAKVDLRVAQVIEAQHVEGADKLLKLRLSLGTDATGKPEERTVFSGIKSAYKPEELNGKFVVLVANLKARKMKFGMSEGMILAAGDGKDIFLITPHEGAQPGTRVT
jgi:methionyl-tRNA synthetase